jgi:hypothetical protein
MGSGKAAAVTPGDQARLGLDLTRTPKLNSRKRTQGTQREWDLKISPAAIFVAFVFIIHLSGFAFFVFSRGNFGFRA